MTGIKQGPARRWARKIGWYRASVRTDWTAARAKRRTGVCCAAVVWSATADLTGRHGRISDGSGILFEKKIQRTARAAGNARIFILMVKSGVPTATLLVGKIYTIMHTRYLTEVNLKI